MLLRGRLSWISFVNRRLGQRKYQGNFYPPPNHPLPHLRTTAPHLRRTLRTAYPPPEYQSPHHSGLFARLCNGSARLEIILRTVYGKQCWWVTCSAAKSPNQIFNSFQQARSCPSLSNKFSLVIPTAYDVPYLNNLSEVYRSILTQLTSKF